MTHTTRRSLLWGLAAAPVLLASPAIAGATSHVGGHAFGTYWRVVSAGSHHNQLINNLARRTFSDVNRAMSPHDPTSEVSRFNMPGGADTRAASPGLLAVTNAALELSRISDGAFDPTVGPAVGRFGFGPIGGQRTGDWRGITVSNGRLVKSEPDLTLDLCGIAKGYAIDLLAQRLGAAGVTDVLIDVGGELRAVGRHPSGRAWRTSIATPFADDGESIAIVSLDARAIATSGVAENGYDIGGRWVSHLIDPHAGQPINTHLLSVSVLNRSAMFADGLATMLAVMGPERGVKFAAARGIDALFIGKTATGPNITMTGDMNRNLIT